MDEDSSEMLLVDLLFEWSTSGINFNPILNQSSVALSWEHILLSK